MDNKNLITIVDIDGTLAIGHVACHLTIYNKKLSLAMTEEEITFAARRYKTTLEVPQIIKVKEKRENAFNRIREEIRISSKAYSNLPSLPGSREGIKRLDKFTCFGGYYTGRRPEIMDTTKKWLIEKNFPFPKNVVCCVDHTDKIRKIIYDWLLCKKKPRKEKLSTILLIDDSWQELIQATQQMVEEKSSVKRYFRHLAIVAFGATEKMLPPQTELQVIPLPSWKKEKALIELINLKKEDNI